MQLKEAGLIKTPFIASAWKKVQEIMRINGTFLTWLELLMESMCKCCSCWSGTKLFHVQKTHSIVLLSVCDASYRFTPVDIGDSGRQSDGSVYANSNLGYAIENKLLNISPDAKVTGSTMVLPYVFAGDDTFGLKRHLMKPYPFSNLGESKLVYKYRLSHS